MTNVSLKIPVKVVEVKAHVPKGVFCAPLSLFLQ